MWICGPYLGPGSKNKWQKQTKTYKIRELWINWIFYVKELLLKFLDGKCKDNNGTVFMFLINTQTEIFLYSV